MSIDWAADEWNPENWDLAGGDDVYRLMWENMDDGWENELHQEAGSDWYDGQHLDNNLLFATSTPPSRSSQARHTNHLPTSPTHDAFASSTSLAPLRNTSSSSFNPRTQRQQPLTRPTEPAQHPPSSRRARPTADHREDWLDRTTAGGTSSFGYVPENFFDESPARRPQEYDGIDIDDILNSDEDDMPARSTRRRQPNRGGVVDLTRDASSPGSADADTTSQSRKRPIDPSTRTRPSKRPKPTSPQDNQNNIEELDLTNEAPSAEDELLATQQTAAVLAQQQNQSPPGPVKLGARTCIICMEPFTNATVTACGHIYCHECLAQALMVGEKNSERGVGTCPVCRKPVSRKKANQVVPMSFMKGAAWKGKRKAAG